MSVYIKPTVEIKKRLGIQEGGYYHKRLANLCMKYMAQYVPKDSGELRRKAHIEDTDIVYPGPYAHYVYEGKLWIDPVTGSSWARKGTKKIPTNIDLQYHEPGTGHHWDKRMVSANIKEITKTLEKEMSGKK